MTTTDRPDLLKSNLRPSIHLSSDDLKGAQRVTVTIEDIRSKEVELIEKNAPVTKPRTLVSFVGKKKEMIFNPTNLNALEVLLCTTYPVNYAECIGKKVFLGSDPDINPDGRDPTVGLRIVGSPDATKERAELFERAWTGGDREGGKLAKRLKKVIKKLEKEALAAVKP